MQQNRKTRLLELLTTRCDFLTLEQIARTLWMEAGSPKRSAAQALRRLEGDGLVERFSLLAGPETELQEPLALWLPRGAEPAFCALSNTLRSRWSSSPSAQTAFVATRRAANRSAGRAGKRPSLAHATHDLHLNQVCLRYYLHEPNTTWCQEHELRAMGLAVDALPDALVISSSGERRAVELAGRYSPNRLRQLWTWVQEDGTALELW